MKKIQRDDPFFKNIVAQRDEGERRRENKGEREGEGGGARGAKIVKC